MGMEMNDSGCCVYVAPEEGEVCGGKKELFCGTGKKNCGGELPFGSGTLAGCNSTTTPKFGAYEVKRGCKTFKYYGSGNTTEFENVCGNIDKLSAEEVKEECVVGTKFTVEACEACGGQQTVEKCAEVELQVAENTKAITGGTDVTPADADAAYDGKSKKAKK